MQLSVSCQSDFGQLQSLQCVLTVFHLQHCCLDPGRSPLLDNRSGRGARSPKTVCLQIQWMPNKLQSSLSFSPTEL